MNFSKEDSDFFNKLREDMLQTRQRRFQYQITKVTSLGGLIGVASLLTQGLPVETIFYIIPFIAMAFDFFILSESFTLRRMAAFVQSYKQEARDAESQWEKFARMNPDRFSSVANFIVTTASCLGCFLMLLSLNQRPLQWLFNPVNPVWLLTVIICLMLFKRLEAKLLKQQWYRA